MKLVRLGLIGTGKHGSRYAKHIVEDLPQAELAAVCRRDRQQGEKLAASYGCPFYADYHALMQDARIDAVALVVPPAFHGEIVAAACAAGKHLLIEKPLAVDRKSTRLNSSH